MKEIPKIKFTTSYTWYLEGVKIEKGTGEGTEKYTYVFQADVGAIVYWASIKNERVYKNKNSRTYSYVQTLERYSESCKVQNDVRTGLGILTTTD